MQKNVITKTNYATIKHHGLDISSFRDFYHILLRLSWPRFIISVVAGYICINLIFAMMYHLNPGSISGATPYSFLHSFAFSVQTMATIGYGVFAPATPSAHLTVVFESITSLLYTALCTGLTFAKFSRPNARVTFSKYVLLSEYNGQSALIFRMANARANILVQASVRVVALKHETTAEGYTMRRQSDIILLRENTLAFSLPWTVIHQINEKSPLFGMSLEDIVKSDVTIIVALTGIDDIYSSQVHAFHTYHGTSFRKAKRFTDIIKTNPDRSIEVDHQKIHEFIT